MITKKKSPRQSSNAASQHTDTDLKKKTITSNLGQVSNVLTWFTMKVKQCLVFVYLENFRKIFYSLAVQQGTRRDNIRVL